MNEPSTTADLTLEDPTDPSSTAPASITQLDDPADGGNKYPDPVPDRPPRPGRRSGARRP